MPESRETSDNPIDVLAFGAHPDDVELAIGGTVSLLVSQGHRVAIVDLTRGEMATRGDPEVRKAEAAAARDVLGVRVRENLDLPDGGVLIDDHSRAAVVGAIRKFAPVVVLAPAEKDLHPDHQYTGRLIRECCFLAGLKKWGAGGEPHRPRTVLHYFLHTQHEPDVVVDVTEHFEVKRQACLAYKSQFHDPVSQEPATYISSSSFWTWWEARSRHYGNLIGAAYGEPFLHAGPIPLKDPVALFTDYGYYPKAGRLRGEDLPRE
jgi:bacillithiol biosynthesis deacetylase BshB1